MSKSYGTAMIRPFEYDAVAIAALLSTDALPTQVSVAMLRDKTKAILSSLLSTPFPDVMIL